MARLSAKAHFYQLKTLTAEFFSNLMIQERERRAIKSERQKRALCLVRLKHRETNSERNIPQGQHSRKKRKGGIVSHSRFDVSIYVQQHSSIFNSFRRLRRASFLAIGWQSKWECSFGITQRYHDKPWKSEWNLGMPESWKNDQRNKNRVKP